MPTRKLAAITLAAVALAASGCGKSSKAQSVSTATTSAQTTPSTTATTTPASTGPETRAVFVTKVSTICQNVLTGRTERARNKSANDIATVGQELAVFEQGVLTALERLSPPQSLKGDWHTIVNSARSLATDTANIAAAAKAGQLKAATTVKLITARHAIEQHALAVAHHDHMTGCLHEI